MREIGVITLMLKIKVLDNVIVVRDSNPWPYPVLYLPAVARQAEIKNVTAIAIRDTGTPMTYKLSAICGRTVSTNSPDGCGLDALGSPSLAFADVLCC
jgi:hypothetical protein